MNRRPAPAPSSHRIRIVGGRLRGSKIDVIDAPGLRPTPDRVRETLFNWLAPWIDGARCLDLFAGTGALGIEAISRGAAGCVFVERNADAARGLRATLERLKVDNAELVVTDWTDYLGRSPQPFDLVFVDPPFAADLWSTVADALEASGSLAPQALVYIESPATTQPLRPPGWDIHRERVSGDVRHALYRRMR